MAAPLLAHSKRFTSTVNRLRVPSQLPEPLLRSSGRNGGSCRRRLRFVERSTSGGQHFVVVDVVAAAVEFTAPNNFATGLVLRANHKIIAALIAFNPELQLMIVATICSVDQSNDGILIRGHNETFNC